MQLFVLDVDLSTKGIVEAYERVEWSQRAFTPGAMTLLIDQGPADTPIQKGRFVFVPSTAQVYRVDQVLRTVNRDGIETLEVTAREVSGIFGERIIVPPGGFSHDVQTAVAAETAMKHYVDAHAGPGATVARQVPNLVIAPDLGRGDVISFEGRFQNLDEVLADLGRRGEVGWGVTFDLDAGEFTFDVLDAYDRTTEVFVDVEFETSLALEWLTSDLSRRTWALAAGQGEGVLRTTAEVWGSGPEPAGFDRREMFVDANDVTDSTALEDRGLAKLLETLTEDAFKIEVNPSGSFRFDEHYFVGDLVTVRHRAWGILVQTQVVGATRAVSASAEGGAQTTTIEVGRVFPTLRSKVRPPDNGSARK